MDKYFTINQKSSELNIIREKGYERGVSCGLSVLDEIFTIKKGFPIFIAGAPYAGKTEFVLEILINLSITKKWKHFIYIGEGGDVENVFAELVSKHMGKQYHKGNFGASDTDIIYSSQFIEQYFVIANHDTDFTINEFYDTVSSAERELNIKFDTTVFDPFNDIKDETALFGGREDKYLAHALKQVRISSKKNNRVDILVNHIADVKAINDKESGFRYMPEALPNEWAGGRTWWRRAFTMILIYRPPNYIKLYSECKENETHIIIQKSKPKGVGKIGRASIYFDWKKNRYYCFEGSQILYSCETMESILPKSLVESKMQPNTNFSESVKDLWEPETKVI